MVELLSHHLLIAELSKALEKLDSIGSDAAAAHISMAIDILKRDEKSPE